MNFTDKIKSKSLARPQQQPSDYSITQILNIVQCGIGGLILITNLTFLIILVFGRWRLHRPKRYALSANLALADVISGLVLMSLSLIVLFELYGGTMIYLILETAMSANFAMCTLCYNAILRIQYVAVLRPIRYFLYLTTTRLFTIVTLIWTIAHAYAFGKGYILFFESTKYAYTLAVCELAIIGGAWLINLIAYVCVFCQTLKKVRLENSQSRYSSKNQPSTVRLIKKNSKNEDDDDPRFSGNPQSEYSFLITMGLNIFIFIVSYAPLWVNWIMAFYWKRETYFEERNAVTRHLLLLVCFVRAVFEPVVHILRQPKLICGNQYSDSRD